jgi:hypothetical protein
MIRVQRRTGLLLAATAVFGAAWGGRTAFAQGDDDFDPPQPPAVPQQVFVVNDVQLDQWVFGGGRNAGWARDRLDTQLTLRIDEIDQACGVTEDQRKKLRLAGRGDIKRFFDKVEEKRRAFQAVAHDRAKIGGIFQEIQPLQVAFNAGLFGEGSLFAKTLVKTLDADQSRRYETALRERRQFHYRSRVDLVVATLGNAVGLSTDQRRRFTKLYLDETRPPKSFGRNDYQAVLLQAANLPEEKLKPIFNDTQWRVLSRYFAQVRGMEQFLRTNGYVPDGEPAGAGADTGAFKAQGGRGIQGALRKEFIAK